MADPFHLQCRDAARDILAGLNLPGIGSNVLTQFLGTDAQLAEPALVLTTEGLALSIRPLTTGSREVGYPVKMRMVDRVMRPGDENAPEWFGWEDRLIDAFPTGRKDDYPKGVHRAELLNRSGVEQAGRAYQLADGEWLVTFWTVRPNPGG